MNTPDKRGEAKKYGKVRTGSKKGGSCNREMPKMRKIHKELKIKQMKGKGEKKGKCIMERRKGGKDMMERCKTK